MKCLSASSTFFYKFIAPFILIGPGTIGLIVGLFIDKPANEKGPGFAFLLLWLGIVVVINWENNFPLKKVALGEQELSVSNYQIGIVIPLANIDDVQQTGGSSWWRWPPKRVILTLRVPSEFGTTIMFIPSEDFDVLQEIKQARGDRGTDLYQGETSSQMVTHNSFCVCLVIHAAKRKKGISPARRS